MAKSMTKWMMAMALAAGCAGGALQEGEATGGEEEVATAGDPLSVDLRVRAVNADEFANLTLLAQRVEILADGRRVPVAQTSEFVDLANMLHAEKVANFQVPEGTKWVDVKIHLAPVGVYDRAEESGIVDTPSTVLSFRSPVENLLAKNKAVVEVNATKSLVHLEPGRYAMVPNFQVKY